MSHNISLFNNPEVKKTLKQKIKQCRDDAELTQQALADMIGTTRTSLSQYESDHCEKLPDLSLFTELCLVLNTEPNYLLGFSEEKSITTKAICETMHLSRKTIEKLIHNPMAAKMIDAIVSSDSLEMIDMQIKWLKYYNKDLKGLLTTAFKPKFKDTIEELFQKYYNTTFPADYSEENYIEFLKNKGLFRGYANSDEFIKYCLLPDAINNIYFSHPDFDTLDNNQKQDCIIEVIAMHSYSYLMWRPHMDGLDERLTAEIKRVLQKLIDL